MIEYLPAVSSVFTRFPAGVFSEIVKQGPTEPASGWPLASATVTPTARAMQSAAASEGGPDHGRRTIASGDESPMKAEEIGAGLWRWVAFHEEWRKDVGCLYVETDESVCLIDPLVPADERDVFLRHLDADVARAGCPVHVLLTVYWHVRSAPELLERYGATLWAPARSVLPVERRTRHPGEPAASR